MDDLLTYPCRFMAGDSLDIIRIVSWNIRAGGGRRIQEIDRQLSCWNADVVVLSEFRGTPASDWLGKELGKKELSYQLSTVDPQFPARNRLLIASRWPLQNIESSLAPTEPGRWIMAHIQAPLAFKIGAMHIPNYVTGRKYQFHDAVLSLATQWLNEPAILIGDTNTGRIGLDEEVPVFSYREEKWMVGLETAGWHDGYRYMHGNKPAYTWYSPNGRNGFRLDEAFIHRSLIPRLHDTYYAWSSHTNDPLRRDAVSDHAAVIVELMTPAFPANSKS